MSSTQIEGRRPTTRITTAAVACCLGLSLFCATPARAATLEELQDAAISAGEDYQAAQDKVDGIQQQIDDQEARIDEIEAQIPDQREKAADAVAASYKMQQGSSGLIELVLSSKSWDDFVSQVHYLDSISTHDAEELGRLNDLRDELAQSQQDLAQQKAQAEQDAAAAQQALDAANEARDAAVAAATAQAAQNQAAYRQGDQGPTEGSLAGGSASGDYAWVATSMYGTQGDGCLYGTTASGDIVTPTSMGVAMKTLPLGTVVELSYNGRTVRAVVNDRGPYAGNRQIDLQPAVAAALGFSGVGTVGYRVVG